MKQYVLKQPYNLYITLKDVYSVIIALLPVIMIYNVPIVNKGLSTILLGVLLPYALYCIIKPPFAKLWILIPFIIFMIYIIFRSRGDFTNIFLMSVVCIHALGAANNSINISLLRKTIEIVAMIASALVIIQTILYYVFGAEIEFIIKPLVLQDMQYYFYKESGTLYRPCAFFMEPSHFVQFSAVALISILFPEKQGEKIKLVKAAFIVLGSMLTTSGMGIMMCLGILLWYFLNCALNNLRKNFAVGMTVLLGGIIFLAVIFVFLMQFDFFNLAIQRIFGEVDGYNAIWGRTLFWDSTIGQMSSADRIMGYGSVSLPDNYMTGLMELIYCYGYIGCILLVFAFMALFFSSHKKWYPKILCLIYLGLLLIANLFSFIILSFWFSNIIASVYDKALDITIKEEHKIKKVKKWKLIR